jgi:hypothetical protein
METNLFGGILWGGDNFQSILAKFLHLLVSTHFFDLKLVKCHAINKCGGL